MTHSRSNTGPNIAGIRKLRFLTFRFRVDEGGHRSKHSTRHIGPFAKGPLYTSGDAVRETGIYEVAHSIEHRAEHEVVLLNGDVFPRCETCKTDVRFRLIRTAPYIFQDADFEES